ncbi:XdhC family protein [Haloimpatiens sp. FM7330]|uniref:XdhC family protein n=1 Tax=Haloimpatiens sp. FM7330 TaxID=3298610 RepID=UPI00362961C4
MDEKILKRIYESLNKGEKVALVTVTNSQGSTPRKRGAIMAVWEDGKILGSVGGGKIEYEVIAKAVECIKKSEDSEFDYKLNESGNLGMQCGGQAKGFIKIFNPRPKLIIAGGGHIGQQLFKLAKILDFYTVILDDREEFANSEIFEGADEVIVGDIGLKLSNYKLEEDTYVVIVTRGHKSDEGALEAVVGKKANYIGMIGSSKKILHIMNNLIEKGISKEALQKVYAPVGLNISSQMPAEIAFGIMSEILLIKNKGSLEHLRDIKKINL